MRNEIVLLLAEDITLDEIGQPIPTYRERQVFADRKPITSKEFYISKSSIIVPETGVRPAICFVLDILDYEGEEVIRYNGCVYKVYRTYYNYNKNETEVYCEVRSGVLG